jgi:3-deoxy-D-manno-octulosonate 8-phosphate phosphatase (KDO 8-P phosphatase)
MWAAREILKKTGHSLEELCYVGDDIIDLPVMEQCGLAIATANARQQVKEVAHYVTPNPGGHGAGRDAIDFILSAQGTLDKVIRDYLKEDNHAAEIADVGVGNM